MYIPMQKLSQYIMSGKTESTLKVILHFYDVMFTRSTFPYSVQELKLRFLIIK